jgi:hypothetical protein
MRAGLKDRVLNILWTPGSPNPTSVSEDFKRTTAVWVKEPVFAKALRWGLRHLGSRGSRQLRQRNRWV